MRKFQIELSDDQVKMALLYAKLEKQTIEEFIQEQVKFFLESIGRDMIYDYLKEQKEKIPTTTEFRNAGISDDEIKVAMDAGKNLGMKFELD